MKTLNKFIRLLPFALILVFSMNDKVQAQNDKKEVFVRVYNSNGKKIEKGHVIYANDSVLGLKRGSKVIGLNYINIGFIKTKRSGGHNVLMGSLIGTTVGALSGATLIEPDPPESLFGFSRGDNAAIGAFVGMFAGAAVGGVTAAIKKPETFIIDGQGQNWQLLRGWFSKQY